MNRPYGMQSGMPTDDSPPSEAWLFAQQILGKPIPPIESPERRARAARERLQYLAQFSTRHADELRRLEAAEAEARRKREVLEWAASVSDEAADKLRALQRKEADERGAWRRAEQYAERLLEGTWDPNQHPRAPQGTPEGGQWVAKGGAAVGALASGDSDVKGTKGNDARASGHETQSTDDLKAKHLRQFDKGHDLTLRAALKKGKLSAGDITRIKFTDEEIKQILKSAEKPGSSFNLDFYTAQNLPDRLRAEADKDFPDLPGDEKYAMQAFISNQRRARTILMVRNAAFRQYVGQLYDLLRGLNPPHFLAEKGLVVATGKEPVLGGEASRLGALVDMLIYLAFMKGAQWGTSKITSIVVGPEAAADITIAFKGGGKLTIRNRAEYGPESLENAIERAAAGERVTIDPPVPKPPRPSLAEVPRITDDPRAFRRWFNELTPDELTAIWKNPKLRRAVERGLRWPGRQHEWLMIARAPKFKEWGLSAEQIAEMRTPTSRIRFKNPPGGHRGEGSMTTHNQLKKLIDSSPDFATFKTRLQKWANDRLDGGAGALPPGLRP
jgi:hypothetical protein